MFSKLTTITTVVLLTLFVALISAIALANQIDSTKNIDDKITELFYDCKCVPFQECERNRYATLNTSELVKCSNIFHGCCKNSGQSEEPLGNNSTSTNVTTQKPSTYNEVNGNTNCGELTVAINARILNPNSEPTDGQPWIVEIFQKIGNNKTAYRFKCAGTLIHPRVVLTAMHCFNLVSEQAMKVVATGKEAFQSIGADPDNERDVLKVVKHPKYYPLSLHNDLALIILQKEFLYGSGTINSICLPGNNQDLDGRKCVAVGWGQNPKHASTFLRKVEVPIVNFQQCQNFLRRTRLGENFNLHESSLCAGGEEGKDTCKGDGGGPLICFGDNDRYFQAGIVSWGVSCGVVDEPGLYTNVSLFKDWIVEELKNYDIKLEPSTENVLSII